MTVDSSTDAPAPSAPIEAEAGESGSVDVEPAPLATRRPRRRMRVSIQSKLLLMLLATSVLSALIVGFVGYRSGTDALRESAFERLTEVRESRISEIELRFETLEDAMVVNTRGRTAIEAVAAFSAGFEELRSSALTTEQDQALFDFYEQVFVPRLEAQLGITTRYHDYFRELTERFEYDDVMLLDNDGNVVYTAYKGVDLGTNVLSGPLRDTGLGRVYEDAIESNAIDFVAISDFERYQPAYAVPSAFVASPVGAQGEIAGVLVVQLPITVINRIMTADGDWPAQGLGATGETYLAGPDFYMRSVSRLVLEDPEEYRRLAVAAGLDEETAAFAVEVGGTILLQTVRTEAVQRALRDETGTLVGEEYLGRDALVAYSRSRPVISRG